MSARGKAPCCSTPENHIRLHRSWRSVIVRLVLAVMVSGVVLWGSLGNFPFGLEISIGKTTVTLPVFLLIALVLVSRPLLLMFDCRHEIACHHVRSVQGRCSLRRQFIEIPYGEILGVRASQSILERLLNVGSILVWTASAEHPDLVMKGIGDPEHFARIIGGKIDSSIMEEVK